MIATTSPDSIEDKSIGFSVRMDEKLISFSFHIRKGLSIPSQIVSSLSRILIKHPLY